jgi:hypothetical protein
VNVADLVVRKMPWTFDTSVPFHWQPANPLVGIFGNLFTFFAVPFEQYIVSALREAKDRVTNPAVAGEAPWRGSCRWSAATTTAR